MSQLSSLFAMMVRTQDRLDANTPELSDEERQAFFGHLSHEEREQAADLFWSCETPQQREAIYETLRQWLAEYARSN